MLSEIALVALTLGFSLKLADGNCRQPRSLKNDQYSAEGQSFHQDLAPALVIISGKSLA